MRAKWQWGDFRCACITYFCDSISATLIFQPGESNPLYVKFRIGVISMATIWHKFHERPNKIKCQNDWGGEGGEEASSLLSNIFLFWFSLYVMYVCYFFFFFYIFIELPNGICNVTSYGRFSRAKVLGNPPYPLSRLLRSSIDCHSLRLISFHISSALFSRLSYPLDVFFQLFGIPI